MDSTVLAKNFRRQGSTAQYLRKLIVEDRLGNWFGVVYAALGGVAFAYVFSARGMSLGVMLILLIVSLPAVFATIFNPFFGIFTMISISYFLAGVNRAMPDVPLGLVVDFMVVFLAFGVYYKNLYVKDWSFARSPIARMVLVYMGYVFASVANPIGNKMCYIYTIRSMAGYMIMFFIISFVIKTKAHIKMFVKLWLILSLLAALYGLKQEHFGLAAFEDAWVHADPKRYWLMFQWGHLRKFSFLAGPADFGIHIGYTALLAMLLALGKTSRRNKIILFVTSFIMFQAMLASGTRAAFVIFPIGAVLYVMVTKKRKLIYSTVFVGVLFIGLINLPIRINSTFERFKSAFQPSDDPSYLQRIENQRRIRPWVWKHPFGGGLGATGVWGERFAPHSFLAGFPPDSGYVRVAVELGWVGLTLNFALWLAIFRQGINSYFSIRDPSMKNIVLAMMCVLFSLFIVNYPQEATKQLPTSLLFWVAAAIINRGSQIENEMKERMAISQSGESGNSL